MRRHYFNSTGACSLGSNVSTSRKLFKFMYAC